MNAWPRRLQRARAVFFLSACLAALVAFSGCEKVALLAPQDSLLTLNASGFALPSNGSVEIIASVIESAGTAVHNGTLVTFVTTVGRLDPPEARTNNGLARVRLHADGQSGAALVTAFSGAARDEIEILIGGAAAGAVTLAANPRTIAAGGTTEITAHVADVGGSALPAVTVTFSSDAGTLSASSAPTDASGIARVQLTTDRTTVVTARVPGSLAEPATLTVLLAVPIPVTLTATPGTVPVGAPTLFTATATVPAGTNVLRYEWDFTGDGIIDRTTTGPTVSHAYSTPGNKAARVRVVASDGSEGTALVIVIVEPAMAAIH